MALDALRRSLAGKLLSFRNIRVHRLDEAFMTELLPTHKLRESVKTYPIKPAVKISVSAFKLSGMKRKIPVKNVKFIATSKGVTVRKFRIKLFSKSDIRVHNMPARSMKTWSGYTKIIALPQERSNRLKFVKSRPQVLNNEMILAWYGPIVEGAVIKLALNKQRGTLLIWYDPRSRQFSAKGVYLIRRLGLGSKPEWRWV